MRTIGVMLLVASACAGDRGRDGTDAAEVMRHPSWRRTRIAVSDGETGVLSVIDVEDEEVTATVDLSGPALLVSTETGAHAAALLPGQVRFVTSGVAIVDHIDHIHIYKSAPRLVDHGIAAASARLVSHEGWLAIAQSDPALPAALAVEQALLDEETSPRIVELAPPGGSTGAAARLGGAFVVALESSHVLDDDGAKVQNLSGCTAPAGAATGGDHVAFACEEGILGVNHRAGAPFSSEMVPYPAGAPGRRARTLAAHPDHRWIAADFSTESLLVADLDEGQASELSFGADVCDFALDPGRGSDLVVLTSSGVVIRLDLAGRQETARISAVEPFDCTAATRPRLAVAPERAYVSDPAHGQVQDADLAAGVLARPIEVGGIPHHVALMGLDLANVNLGPCMDPCIENFPDAGPAGVPDAGPGDGSDAR